MGKWQVLPLLGFVFPYIKIEKERNIAFFNVLCKRTKCSPVLFRSLQKNVVIFAFYSVLCKRILRSVCSFPFCTKERKRTERSFGSYKSSKTWKKNGKERNIPFKERKRMERTERKRTLCPTLTSINPFLYTGLSA